eukprot:s10_g24.t2
MNGRKHLWRKLRLKVICKCARVVGPKKPPSTMWWIWRQSLRTSASTQVATCLPASSAQIAVAHETSPTATCWRAAKAGCTASSIRPHGPGPAMRRLRRWRWWTRPLHQPGSVRQTGASSRASLAACCAMPKGKGPSSPDKADSNLTGIIDGLSTFRSELAAKQQQLLTKLDMELEKVKLLAQPLPPAAQSARAWAPSVGMATLQLPGAVEESTETEVPEVEGVFNSFTSSLPSVAEMRKKKMPWIHKQGSRMMCEEEGNQARAFSQLNPEYATNRLRHAAIDEIPAQEVFRKGSKWTQIVQHNWFERIGLGMIYLNALWIAIDIDYNKALVIIDAAPGFIVVEIIFGIYFSVELFCRYMAYIYTKFAFKDAWFVFDLLLVFIMVTETWLMPLINSVIEGIAGAGSGFGRSASVLRVLKVLRVLRTARIVRVARYMPELMILIKGLLVAARSVFFTLVLLLLVTYIFSITFTQLSQDTPLSELFPKVPTTVLELVLQGVIPDQAGFFTQVANESPFMGAMVLVFIMVGSLIIMNMLVGVLVEAVQTVASCEHEQIHIDFAKRVLFEMIDQEGADENGDNLISEEEFESLMQKPEAVLALNRLGVEIYAALEYGKLLFEDGQPLTFGEFLEGMLMLRGSNQTTVKDIVTLRKFTADEFSHLHTVLEDLFRHLSFKPGHTRPEPQIMPRSKSSPVTAQIRDVDEV